MSGVVRRCKELEAEVERLKKVYATTNDSWKKLQAENIKLRAVVEAARVYVMEHDKIPNLRTLDEWIIIVAAIRNALAELDKEGER